MTTHVKVRLTGERRYRFVAPGGRTVVHRIHAAEIPADQAPAIAEALVRDNPTAVAAARVTRDGRTVARYGEPTPPRPVYGTAGGYAFLVDVNRSGRAVCEVKDEHGRWAFATWDVIERCYEEARGAGATGTVTVYATGCGMCGVKSLRFVQVSN